MKSPLKLVSRRAPKIPALAIPSLPKVPPRTRRIATLSTACAVVVSVGAGSAMFVDYLADRAMARAADTLPAPVIREIKIASNNTVASDSQADTDGPQRTVRPPEIVVAPVVPIAADPENAIEVPLGDPMAEPDLNLDEVETAALDEGGASAIDGDDAADDTITAAISDTEVKPQTADNAQQPDDDETDLAALPGVDVGGLAGDRSETTASGDSSRTVNVKSAVNMRASPKSGSKVLTVIPARATVSLFGCENWCEVSYKGRKGYIYKSFVGSAQPATKAEKTAAEDSEQAGPRAISQRLQ